MDMPDIRTIESIGIVALCIGFVIWVWRASRMEAKGPDNSIPGGGYGGSGGDCGDED